VLGAKVILLAQFSCILNSAIFINQRRINARQILNSGFIRRPMEKISWLRVITMQVYKLAFLIVIPHPAGVLLREPLFLMLSILSFKI
jgi:hypothetical protein